MNWKCSARSAGQKYTQIRRLPCQTLNQIGCVFLQFWENKVKRSQVEVTDCRPNIVKNGGSICIIRSSSSSSYKLILIFLSYLITRDAYHHIQRSHWPRLDFDCICSVVTRSRTSSGVTLCQTQKLYIVLDRDHLLTNCRLLVWMQYNTIITIHYMYVCLHIFGLF